MQWGLSSQQCHLDLINGVKLKEGEPCLGTPDFGANLIWELRRDTETDSYSVRVLYNGEPLEISCGKEKKVTECSFEHFQKEMHANFIFTKESQLTTVGNIECILTVKINTVTCRAHAISLTMKSGIPFNG